MSRFDRIVWRTIGVLFLSLLLYAAWEVIRSWSLTARNRDRSPDTVATADVGERKEPLKLGDPTSLKGTSLVRVSLETDVERAGYSSFKGSGSGPRSIYNFLYVNASDLSSWWLFERPDRVITQVHDLRAEVEGPDKPIVATLFEVVPADTDGDGRLTGIDREAVYFSPVDGKKPVEIIPPGDGIQFVEQVPPGQVLLIHRREKSLVASLFSVSDGSKIKESVLPTGKQE